MSASVELMDLRLEADTGAPLRVILQWPPDGQGQQHLVQGFVLMRRPDGVMVALPENVLEEASLLEYAQEHSEVEALVGPFRHFTVPLLVTGDDGLLVGSEEMVGVLVVDMSRIGAEQILSLYSEESADADLINHFSNTDPGARPDLAVLLEQVQQWVSSEITDRLAFYSAQEEEEETEPVVSTRRRRPKAGLGEGSTPPGRGSGVPKAGAKKPTVATLATQMETILAALPALTDQLANLTERQAAFEKKSQSAVPPQHPFKPMATGKASMPVSSFLHQAGAPLPMPGGIGKILGPPPPTRHVSWVDDQQVANGALAEDEPPDPLQSGEVDDISSPMAQALLEQSKALRALMVHFQVAGADPMSDLSASTPTTGVKGTLAREKLQRELSQGSGQFFLKVCQSIQRRMSPTSRLASNFSEARDVSLLAYLERHGGYGQNRELGMVQWSLGYAFDAAAKGEWGLVSDHLALTSVMVEQAAMDANRWHLAWLLRLLDDPPQNLWLSRGQTATGARRPFAPLCAPSWTTTALAYMKEAEVLQTKKAEVLGSNKSAGSTDDPPSAKPAPKRKPGGGKGKGHQQPAPGADQAPP